jgi:hypothetical protein
MPDDHHPLMPRRNSEDIDLGAIKSDLEFLIERVSRLPTRKEQALKPLYVMVGSAGGLARVAHDRLFGHIGHPGGLCEPRDIVF